MQAAAALTLTAGFLVAPAEAASRQGMLSSATDSVPVTHSQRALKFFFSMSLWGDDGSPPMSTTWGPRWDSPGGEDPGADGWDNEGDEGDEGDEGGNGASSTFSFGSSSSCTAKSSTQSYSTAIDAHVSAVAGAFATACVPQYDGSVDALADKFNKLSALAVANAIADASTECTSSGDAFGCAKAGASAQSWASATAEANARAVSEALGNCGTCTADAANVTAAGENLASTLVDLTTEATANAESFACVKGDQAASSEAFANCFAEAYAQVFARASAYALLEGKCLSLEAETKVRAATKAEITQSGTCSLSDNGSGNAAGSTDGSVANTVRIHTTSHTLTLAHSKFTVLLLPPL